MSIGEAIGQIFVSVNVTVYFVHSKKAKIPNCLRQWNFDLHVHFKHYYLEEESDSMDIKSMTCFLAVAEKLNFSRAAEALYMSQPALSQRISSLEEELGVSLFQRDHRHVFLTPAGSALLPEIQDIVRRIDALPALAVMNKENQKSRKGHLKVHLDSSIPETMIRVLNKAFDRFYQLYPDVSLSINSVSFGEYENALLTRQADICFIGLKSSEWINPLFNSITLAIEPMVLAYKKRPDEGIAPPRRTFVLF